LKPVNSALNQIPDTDMMKVAALKKAVSEGNYVISAEDLAPKLMESLFRNTILDLDPNGPSGSQLEVDDRAAPKVNGGAMVNQNGSHSAAVPSEGAATKRESR
jgi:Anti-sigma-28 factor, FlgM